MRKLHLLITFLLIISCNKKEKDSFKINGHINGYDKEYIYIDYGKIRDSALIKDNKFYFNGEVENPTIANLSIGSVSTIDKPFYIENSYIELEIIVEKKVYNDTEVNFITVDTLKGTKTAHIQRDFEIFKENNSSDIDWDNKLFKKLSQLLSENPQNGYSGDLLAEISKDSILNRNQLKTLFEKLNISSQSNHSLATIRNVINPKTKLEIGSYMIDFELPDQNDNIVNTNKFKGEILLIDFWASWCIPCRKQNLKLSRIYNRFKKNEFNVLGVSLDTDKAKWLNAIKKDSILWDNVIDINNFDGEIAAIYNISHSIPHNFLINSEGIIIAIDITMKDLEVELEKYFQ